jgi:hypothetical protein
VGDGAVVALEKVLSDELPVRVDRGIGTTVESQLVDVDPGVRDELRQARENVGE